MPHIKILLNYSWVPQDQRKRSVMARAATLRATAWFLLAAPLCSSFTVGGGRGWLQRPGSVGSRSSGSRVARDMFSGIVEEMGEVVSLESNEAMELWDGSVGEGTELVIKAGVALDGRTRALCRDTARSCDTAPEPDAWESLKKSRLSAQS